eukprot:CAMPEP_0194279754 /NCGR_PEP_ID=MMETSP0169-20130528/14107_1 /TAXON_ID=218684 /ORGANISM="Corethron pennatum, Strain L29A3" /LENGTH=333 /DNA_ID=CAMNT_0039024217 /DNA_START=293 /DNA_END=1291 /DNA_ORIENTATION=+
MSKTDIGLLTTYEDPIIRKPTTGIQRKEMNTDIACTVEMQNEIIGKSDKAYTEDPQGSPKQAADKIGVASSKSSFEIMKERLFTKIDAPLRLHATSSTIYSVGSLAWLGSHIWSIVVNKDFGIDYSWTDSLIFLSGIGLIITGNQYLPKGSNYKYYRQQFIATGWIMAADLLLWLWHIRGIPQGCEVAVTPVVLAALVSDFSFIVNHDVTRNEFYERGFITEEFQRPVWSLTVWATHFALLTLKSVGLYHLLVGGTPWLESNSGQAAFGAMLFMSTSMLASWSAFTQGTMVLRRTPFLDKEVFVLVNDFPTWCVFIGCFLPPAIIGVVGVQSS